jgi:hypothetical protein
VNLDTPDGRLIVATCNEAQQAAIMRLLVSAFEEGFNKGATVAEELITDHMNKALDKAIAEFDSSLENTNVSSDSQ